MLRHPLRTIAAAALIAATTAGAAAGTASAKPPVPIEAGKWLDYRDYPENLLRDSVGGETDFRVSVSAEGKPLSCDIVVSSLSDQLDKIVCDKVMTRGRVVEQFL